MGLSAMNIEINNQIKAVFSMKNTDYDETIYFSSKDVSDDWLTFGDDNKDILASIHALDVLNKQCLEIREYHIDDGTLNIRYILNCVKPKDYVLMTTMSFELDHDFDGNVIEERVKNLIMSKLFDSGELAVTCSWDR